MKRRNMVLLVTTIVLCGCKISLAEDNTNREMAGSGGKIKPPQIYKIENYLSPSFEKEYVIKIFWKPSHVSPGNSSFLVYRRPSDGAEYTLACYVTDKNYCKDGGLTYEEGIFYYKVKHVISYKGELLESDLSKAYGTVGGLEIYRRLNEDGTTIQGK